MHSRCGEASVTRSEGRVRSHSFPIRHIPGCPRHFISFMAGSSPGGGLNARCDRWALMVGTSADSLNCSEGCGTTPRTAHRRQSAPCHLVACHPRPRSSVRISHFDLPTPLRSLGFRTDRAGCCRRRVSSFQQDSRQPGHKNPASITSRRFAHAVLSVGLALGCLRLNCTASSLALHHALKAVAVLAG